MESKNSISVKKICIGFDAKRAYCNLSGLGNYSRNLINALARFYPQNRYTLFTPKAHPKTPLVNTVDFKIVTPACPFSKIFKSLWRTKFVVGDIKKAKVEVYHGLSHELPRGIEKIAVKSVVTIHDLIFIRFPHFFKPIDAYIYRKKILHACKVANKIVAISQQTKNDIVELLGVDSSKIEVIYQGCGEQFWKKYSPEQHDAVKEKHKLPPNYLLCVGTIEKRKNLLAILKAKHEFKIEVPLVVVGRKTEYYHNEVLPYIQANKLSGVLFLEEVVDEDLPIIYQNAQCFIYPSLFEGFGIPILEALVSGVPVITSSGGCFGEVAGPSSLFINPTDHAELALSIKKVISDTNLSAQMVMLGKEYAKQFSDEAIAKKHIELYCNLIS